MARLQEELESTAGMLTAKEASEAASHQRFPFFYRREPQRFQDDFVVSGKGCSVNWAGIKLVWSQCFEHGRSLEGPNSPRVALSRCSKSSLP